MFCYFQLCVDVPYRGDARHGSMIGWSRDRARHMTRPASPPAPPCTVEQLTSAFIVRDDQGRAVAYVYFAEGDERLALPDAWTRAEAAEIAQRIARGFTLAGTRDPRA